MAGRFTDKEMRERFERGVHSYKGYTVQAKRDYADVLSFDRGFYIRDGFVVVKDGCNAMPGAVWFNTVESARQAIDILEVVGEKRFWDAHRRVKDAVEKAREDALAGFVAELSIPAAA